MNSHSPSHWASSVQPRRNSGDRDTFKGSSPTGFSGSPSGISTSGSVEFAQLTLSELQAQKRDLKQQLKQYDMNFARKHGRMPVKSEKEPIRHLYETYNALKNRITAMEQEGLHSKPSPMTPPHQVSIQQLSFQQSRAPSMQRTPSPPLSAASGASSGPESSEEEDNPGPSMVRPKGSGKDKSSKLAFSDLPSTPSGAPSQDLAALKAEKGKLHQMLRSYEKDFFKEHKRQVSSFADIKPVASQYRRYKEIKKAIAALQQQGEK
jgi:flagellar biosynthesis/type III secretory pathway chaperone